MRVRNHDITILHKLRNDGRLKHTEIARSMKWPVSTTQERVQRCLDSFVMRPVALIDLRRLGFGSRSIWIVKPHTRDKDAWEARVAGNPSVNTFIRLHHGEYMIETVARSQDDQEELRDSVVANATIIGTHSIVDAIVEERFLTDPATVPAIDQNGAPVPATPSDLL